MSARTSPLSSSTQDRLFTRSRIGQLITIATLAALQPAALPAQPDRPAVTDADIARAARSQPAITEADIEAARRKHRMPSDAELARVPVPSAPRIEALSQPQNPRPVDLGAVAAGYDTMGSPDPTRSGGIAGPALLVFVSFSMPEAALERLAEQASRAGATLLLRGLVDDSLSKTVARVQRVISQRQVSFQIDPQAFERFSVTTTPSFVLVKDRSVAVPCAAGTCMAAGSYALTAGDVSLDYALAFIQRTAPTFAHEASRFLTRMKGG